MLSCSLGSSETERVDALMRVGVPVSSCGRPSSNRRCPARLVLCFLLRVLYFLLTLTLSHASPRVVWPCRREFMTSQEVIDFVGKYRRQRRSAQSASDALVREAISRWRRNEAVVDDTTAVVLYLEWQHLRTPSGMPLPSAVAVDDGSSSVTGSGSGSASAASGAPSSASRRFFGGGGSSGTPSTSAVTSIDGSPVVVVTADQPRLVGRSGRLQRFEPKNELLLAPM